MAPDNPGANAVTPGSLTAAPQTVGPNLEMPEATFGYIPQQYRNAAATASDAFLRGQGFTGTGAFGRYGETSYQPSAAPPGGFYFAPALFDTIADPTLRDWIKYVYSGRGFTDEFAKPAI